MLDHNIIIRVEVLPGRAKTKSEFVGFVGLLRIRGTMRRLTLDIRASVNVNRRP